MTDLSSTLTSILLLLGNAALMIVVAFIFININFSKSIAARKSLITKFILGAPAPQIGYYHFIINFSGGERTK